MIDFFIIGTQKGGTESALFHLNQHPQIYLPKKEIQYFNQPLLYEYHKNDLKKNFEIVVNNYKKEDKLEKIENKNLDNLLIGVKNPEYMYIPKSITLLHNIYPQTKLIIFLREPVSRAYSEYNMYLSFVNMSSIFKMPNSFIESITRDDHITLNNITSSGYYALQRGYYSSQIKHIYNYFPKSQIKILISEQVQKDPQKYYNEIFEFLNVPHYQLHIKNDIHIRKYKNKISKEDFITMYNYYKPYNDELYDLLGYKIEEWENIYKEMECN
jgi:hypothetical protein